jgi:hypothetical protein
MYVWRAAAVSLVAAGSLVMLGAAQAPGQPGAAGQVQPSRDTPGQPAAPASRGSISGRVLAADTGRPIVRARVSIGAAELPGGRVAQTADDGTFSFTELPGGRYTLSASRTGYVGLSYGQRRPLQSGTPLQLAESASLTGVELRLPRGSVVTGRVFDELGDPMPGIVVRVMRYQYAQGTRQLVPAGMGQSDDRGEYRIWGLNPGEYFVSAVAPNLPDTLGGRGLPPAVAAGRGGFLGPGGAGAPGRGRGGRSFEAPTPDDASVAYAPTYYPGVPSVNEARPVNVGLGGESAGIDFSVLLVRTSRIAGRVADADGFPAWSGNVVLIAEGTAGGRAPGQNYAGRINWDGAFSIAGVPPGRYTLRAQSGRDDIPRFAAQPLTVAGDVADVAVVLSPGVTVSGMATLEATVSAVLPNASDFRVAMASTEIDGFGGNTNTRVDREGRFTLENVPAGTHWIRGQAPRGWTLKSATMAGRDVIDTALELRSAEPVTSLRLVFTDKLSDLSGTLTNAQGAPVTEYTVVAFPEDATLWRPQSRHIMTARPDQTGRFQLRGLPAGDYYLAAVDPAEPGEWFDPVFLEQHRASATTVRLGEGDLRTQDLRVR